MPTRLGLELAAREMPRKKLAAEVGVTPGRISQIVGGSRASHALKGRIADALDLTVDELFGDTDRAFIVYVQKSTAASNVPEFVEDPAAIDKIAELLRAAEDTSAATPEIKPEITRPTTLPRSSCAESGDAS
jgi:transcriptional regulator with XRE-family HTH domain